MCVYKCVSVRKIASWDFYLKNTLKALQFFTRFEIEQFYEVSIFLIIQILYVTELSAKSELKSFSSELKH